MFRKHAFILPVRSRGKHHGKKIFPFARFIFMNDLPDAESNLDTDSDTGLMMVIYNACPWIFFRVKRTTSTKGIPYAIKLKRARSVAKAKSSRSLKSATAIFLTWLSDKGFLIVISRFSFSLRKGCCFILKGCSSKATLYTARKLLR